MPTPFHYFLLSFVFSNIILSINESMGNPGSLKIDPYKVFYPISADLTVTLNVDHQTDIETKWPSPTTYTYYG